MKKLTKTYITKKEHSAEIVGSGDMPVLGTPALIAFMENCAMLLAREQLPSQDQTTVGTNLSTNHLHPTPIGKGITVEATLTEVEGRKMSFSIIATDDIGTVAECTHERFVVSRQRFLEKIGL